jgi:type I restriction enzyme, S subunit
MEVITENKFIPKLRFKEFDDDWILKKIDKIAPLQRGFDLPLRKIQKGNYPVVYSNGILRTHNEYKVKGEGVVTGRSGTIGKVTFVKENHWPHNTTLWVTNYFNNNKKFIYYFYLQLKLQRFNAGSTVPTLNRNDVHFLNKRIPNQIKEQQKIASFLTVVDEKLQQLTKKKELIEDFKKGVMQKIFSQEIRFKDDNGNEFPDWEEKKLGEFSKFLRGHSYNSTNVKDSGLLVLRSSNIKNGRLVLDKDLQFVNKKCKEEILLVNKDIVICMANGSKNLVGKSAVYFGDFQGKITIGAFCSIMRSELELSRYILQSVQFKKYLHTLLAGTNINNLKNSELSELKFWIPCSKDEQKNITNFLATIDKKIESVNHQLEKTKEFKKGLLQQMFV